MDDPIATIRVIDGQLVLDDPTALGVIRAVGKVNCKNTLMDNHERIEHFIGRISDLGLRQNDITIVILNVDDPNGGEIAEMLMPNQDATWEDYRKMGAIPFARGLAGRGFIQAALELFDEEAAKKLIEIDGISVVVVDHYVAEVWLSEEV